MVYRFFLKERYKLKARRVKPVDKKSGRYGYHHELER